MFQEQLALIRWRQQIREGDYVCLKKTDGVAYKVQIVEGREITIFDPCSGDYETYHRKRLYPSEIIKP